MTSQDENAPQKPSASSKVKNLHPSTVVQKLRHCSVWKVLVLVRRLPLQRPWSKQAPSMPEMARTVKTEKARNILSLRHV